MLSLPGFIQVMLMLTQARFTTSIVIACREETATATTTVKQATTNIFHWPGEQVPGFSFEGQTATTNKS